MALVVKDLPSLAAGLVEAQQAFLRIRGVRLLNAFQVARVEGGDEDGPGFPLLVLEKIFSAGAIDDLLQDHRKGSCRLVEDPDLDAHSLRRLSQVGIVIVGHHLPDLVAGVEQVAAEVVEDCLLLGEHEPQLWLEELVQEKPWCEIDIRLDEQPRNLPEEQLILLAEEEGIVDRVVADQVEEDEGKREGALGKRAGGHVASNLLVPKQTAVAEGVSQDERSQVLHREIVGKLPACSGEGLTHEGAEVGAPIDEHDSPREKRVQKRGSEGEDSVPQSRCRCPEHVLALRRLRSVPAGFY